MTRGPVLPTDGRCLPFTVLLSICVEEFIILRIRICGQISGRSGSGSSEHFSSTAMYMMFSIMMGVTTV